MADQNALTRKIEIEEKVNARTDLTDTEKEALKGKLSDMLSTLTNASAGSDDRKNQIKKSWELICVTSITSNNIQNAIEMYEKLEDDGTRLRDIINKAYQQFNFLTPIDNMLNFISSLPTPNLQISGVYALLAAIRQKYPTGNVKIFRVEEYVEEEIVKPLSAAGLSMDGACERLPAKVAKLVEDAVKMCVSKIYEASYGEIIFYARECPQNLMEHLPKIVRTAYVVEHFEKVVNFIFALPEGYQKTVGIRELLCEIKERIDEGKPDLTILEEKIKSLENPAYDGFLDAIKMLSSIEVTKM